MMKLPFALMVMLFLGTNSNIALSSAYKLTKIDEVIECTRGYYGTSYQWGGCSRSGIDCSCFMQKCFKSAGIDIPRNSRAQANFWKGEDVTKNNLQKGDLIFFKTRKYYIGHVGLVVSTKNKRIKFIHSSSDNDGVKENYLEGQWNRTFKKGVRLFQTIYKPVVPHKQRIYFFTGKYPQASRRKLTKTDLFGLNQWELRIMRNEIFARHGYEFNQTPDMIAYFQKQAWYRDFPRISKNAEYIYYAYLSDIETSNIRLIQEYEDNPGSISSCQHYAGRIVGKYPQASQRILTEEELSGLNKWELKIMRNEIFARHGYKFQTRNVIAYFSKQDWYNCIPEVSPDNVSKNYLSSIEKRNIRLIKQKENEY